MVTSTAALTSQDEDCRAALAHPQRAAQQAVALILNALDAAQLARLRLLLIDAGAHFHDAVETLRPRPAT